MLVMSRRTNERIVIPSVQLMIKVLEARPKRVRLGLEAPPEVIVFRQEVYDRLSQPDPRPAPAPLRPQASPDAAASPEHRLREHLNNVTLAAALLRRGQLGRLTPEVSALLERMDAECRVLRKNVEDAFGKHSSAAPQPHLVGPDGVGR